MIKLIEGVPESLIRSGAESPESSGYQCCDYRPPQGFSATRTGRYE